MFSDKDSGRARMVEVDVREQQVTDVGESETVLAKALLEALDSGGRSAVEEGRAVLRVEQVRADYSGGSLVSEVDRPGRHREMLLAPIAARTTAMPPPIATALEGNLVLEALVVSGGACAGSPSLTSKASSVESARYHPPCVRSLPKNT